MNKPNLCSIPFSFQSSPIYDIKQVNPSFSMGVLKIAYHGTNKNNTHISKEAFEDAISSMPYCPVICRYIPETDDLGGHDVEFKKDRNGKLGFVDITSSIGVVPSIDINKYWWELVTEKDGSQHEYLCTYILIWDRFEGSKYVLEQKIVNHSMEIAIEQSHLNKDGVYEIDKFHFVGFCLLGSGVEPCFEGSHVEFGLDKGDKYALSKEEYKMLKCMIDTYEKISDQIIEKEGEVKSMKFKSLLEKYNVNKDELTFDPKDLSDDELEAKFEEQFGSSEEKTGFEPEEGAKEPEANNYSSANFKLHSNISEEFMSVLSEIVEETSDGYKFKKYLFIDYDAELGLIYLFKSADGRVYSAPFAFNGDRVEIDFETLKRQKCIFEDYDEGDTQVFSLFDSVSECITENIAEYKEKYANAVAELAELKNNINKGKVEELFSKYDDVDELKECEEYKELKCSCGDMPVEEVEEKIFSLYGKALFMSKHSGTKNTPVIMCSDNYSLGNEPSPYGDLDRNL